jgi:Protein of unknown function (DUF3810)
MLILALILKQNPAGLKKIIARIFTVLMKSKSWVFLIVTAIAIKWVSLYPGFIEKYYSNGLYPLISRAQRILFGWIPFSIGDLFYGFLQVIIVYKTFQLIKTIWQKKINRQYFITGLQQIIFFFLFMYVLFYLLWGLNYNRQGIGQQLDLKLTKYSNADLDSLVSKLTEKVNHYANEFSASEKKSLKRKRNLFNETKEAYDSAVKQYPFLNYQSKSIKPSLFSYAGNYLGFQGYYNPFSGEGQVNTTVPQVLLPFVSCHEAGHQLGFAKENEANFAGYLAAKNSSSPYFRYSVYFDMFNYAIADLRRKDSVAAKNYLTQLDTLVKKDRKELKEFFIRHRNPLEKIIAWGYGEYLKANNQPAGKQAYDEVIAWLIAYYKKYGLESL